MPYPSTSYSAHIPYLSTILQSARVLQIALTLAAPFLNPVMDAQEKAAYDALVAAVTVFNSKAPFPAQGP